MSGRLEISFNSPQCGWMSVGFRDGENEFHTTTAHAPHAAALPELMKVLASLADPSTAENEYTLHWNRDPEEFDFHFSRNAEDLTLEIYQYPTDEREAAERHLVFQHIGTVTKTVAAFAETFDHLYADRDTDEFDFNWRQPFPVAEYELFRNRTHGSYVTDTSHSE
ncbi:MAG: hypothetical protein ACJ73D_09280 [Pyrinomonadaceae bacterium]